MTAVKRTKKNALNVRQRQFVKNYTAGLGIGKSALRAGYAHASEGSALFRNPTVLTALQAAMEKAGMDDPYLAQKVKEGLEATYPEKRSKMGTVLQAEAPDFFTRGQYLDKAFKVRGDYAPDRHIQENRVLTINVNYELAKGLVDCGVLDNVELLREPVGLLKNGEEIIDAAKGSQTHPRDEGETISTEEGPPTKP
jgi:phage terminase small subunit